MMISSSYGKFRSIADSHYDAQMRAEAKRFSQGELAQYNLFVTTAVAIDPDAAEAIVQAEQALPVAARLGRASGGTLTVLRVVTSLFNADLHPVQLAKHLELTQEADIARANDYLAQVASSDDLKGIDIRTEGLTGAPAQTIVLFAQFQHVDLIVMCSHGLTGFKRWWLGSGACAVYHRGNELSRRTSNQHHDPGRAEFLE